MATDDRLSLVLVTAKEWIDAYDERHPPTPRDRLTAALERLEAKYGPPREPPKLTVIDGGRND